MRIALVFLHPFSESMGSVVRVKELALGLGSLGAEVYIISPYERSFDLSDNVHVFSSNSFLALSGLSTPIYHLSKFFYYNKLFPSVFSNIETQFKKVKLLNKILKNITNFLVKKQIDIIQVEQDFAIPLGINLKKETNLPLIADVHNISSEELVSAGILERHSAAYFSLQNKIRSSLGQSDHVIVVSDCMKEYVINNYDIDSTNISVIPPGGRILTDRFSMKKRNKPYRVVYAGLVAYREHVDLFIKSIPHIPKRYSDVQYHVTNKGEAIHHIKNLANKLGIKPTFFWYDKYELVNCFLSSCHIGVLPSSDDIARRMGTPAKLFNYMSVGLPIVASKIGDWANIIEDEKIGLLVQTNDPVDFAKAITCLLDNESLREDMSNNAFNAILQKYNWKKSAEKLMNIYDNFC